MTHVVRNISFSILMQDPATAEIIKSGDELAFEKILYEKWGVEIGEPFEVKSCLHRPVESKPDIYDGNIVLGLERLDPEWILSGNASFEAQVAARDDIALSMEIERMSKHSLNSVERKYTGQYED